MPKSSSFRLSTLASIFCIFILIPVMLYLLSSCSSKPADIEPAPVDTLGTGWKKMTAPSLSYSDIFFINNNTGYLTGEGQIFRSTDGGNTWQKVYQARDVLINIAMGSESNIVFISFNGLIISTKNGGVSFDSVLLSPELINDAFFVNATTVYAIGVGFWKSIDAGSTWTKVQNLPSAQRYRSLHFLNDQYGWVAGSGGPFKTINGGATWEQKLNPDFTFDNGNVFFTDVNNGYVSDGARIAKTSNGGDSWSRVFTGQGNFQDLHFVSTNTGYITEGNYIYKTQDGGNTWIKDVVLPQKSIVELHFTDAFHGWACGTGAVLKYQN